MTKLGDVTIKTAEYRPCYVVETLYANGEPFVQEKRKALFHHWDGMWAVVEYEDGKCDCILAECIEFVQGLMNEYYFGEAAENETCNATD